MRCAVRTKGCLTRPGRSTPVEKLYVRPPSSDQTGTSPRYGFRAAQKTILPPYLPLTGRMTSPCPEVGARHDVCEAPAAERSLFSGNLAERWFEIATPNRNYGESSINLAFGGCSIAAAVRTMSKSLRVISVRPFVS